MKKAFLSVMAILFIATTALAVTKEKVEQDQFYIYETSTLKINPFCMAIVKGDMDAVKKMIELGSDVNEKSIGMTPLMYAARYNRVEIIKLLVKNGAKIETKNNKGFDAMKYAKLSNAKEAMALLDQLS